MNIQTSLTQHSATMQNNNNIEELLSQRKLAKAFKLISEKIRTLGNWELTEAYENIRNTYSAMLKYIISGIDDPQFSEHHRSLIQQALSVNDRAERIIRLKKNPGDKYAVALKTADEAGMSMESLQTALEAQCEEMERMRKSSQPREKVAKYEFEKIAEAHEDTLLSLFNKVWTSDEWKKGDYDTACNILYSDMITANDIAVMTSAVTLALTEMFDQRKIMFLFDAYLTHHTEVSQRALIGIILIIRLYDERLAAYPEIGSRLSLYSEDTAFVTDFSSALMQLQLSSMTESINTKMRNDIIPSIMKGSNMKPNITKIDDIEAELIKNGENPDWHKSMEISDKASAKIREMADMQMEGADVYMSTFTHLKSSPFFQQTAHWFYPFDIDHPLMKNVKNLLESKLGSMMSAILNTSPFCSSDKYSFCFMLESIGSMGQDMLTSQISEQLSGEEATNLIDDAKRRKAKPSDIRRNYIFDLYRFFHSYPYHNQFKKLISKGSEPFSTLSARTFAAIKNFGTESLSLAEFLMRKGFYSAAYELFLTLNPKMTEEDADLWQKIGFCCQKDGNIQEAYINYRTAFELAPESTWTRNHLASAAYSLGLYHEAEEQYLWLAEQDSENPKLISKLVNTLMIQEKFSEALPHLHKLAYLDEENREVQSELAWAQFRTGETDKALERIRKACEQWNEPASIMLMAHLQSLTNNRAAAYENYRKALSMLKAENPSAAVEEFDKLYRSHECYRYACGKEPNIMELTYEAVMLNNSEE